MASARRDLEERAQQAILKSIVENYKQEKKEWLNDPPLRKAIFLYSFFGIKNALLIAAIIILSGFLALVLFPLVGLFGVGALAAGGLSGLFMLILAEFIFLYRSFTNKDLHAKAVAELLNPDVNFTPATIKDKELREKVDKALEYWALIDDEIQKAPKGILRDGSPHAVTHNEVTNWLQAVHNLAEHVDKLRENKVIQQDLQKIPGLIQEYKADLKQATSPEVKKQLERTIADQERQLRSLQALQDNIDKATYQLDSTISALGTIYSQLLLVGSKDESGSKINRLQEEISEQVHQLEDITDAMDEVLYQRAY
ncbi:MAG: hypothetical protein H6631_19230 [Anaerolineaceae bacterium]|nr:hypothetical protein [Anaerolineaceae bacterium]MCB9079743.1 hypothetical protein [Anaerolineaceae bacterium]